MKRVLAFLLAFILAFCNFGIGLVEQMPATPTDLTPVITEQIEVPPDPDPGDTNPGDQQGDDQGGPQIQVGDYVPQLGSLNKYSIVALHDFKQTGHVRGSVWVGGTMTGGPYMYVDDGSIGGSGAGTSYVCR